MADSLLEKATSALGEAKETVTAKATSALGEAKETVTAKATSALGEAKETATASAETTKTDVVKDAVDNVVTRGIDGAKSLLHNLEEKKGEVSSKIVGAVLQFTGSADSSATTVNRDLPVSTDNQPLLAAGDRGVETATPWWKNCCGVLDLLKASSSST